MYYSCDEAHTIALENVLNENFEINEKTFIHECIFVIK